MSSAMPDVETAGATLAPAHDASRIPPAARTAMTLKLPPERGASCLPLKHAQGQCTDGQTNPLRAVLAPPPTDTDPHQGPLEVGPGAGLVGRGHGRGLRQGRLRALA